MFNLLDEPWIPVVMHNGDRQKLGILETLRISHDIKEIYDCSPLITAALYRLLLSILHRVYGETDTPYQSGPSSLDAWSKIWGCGRFDEERVSAYFDRDLPVEPIKMRDRFDLFHPVRPFFQVAGLAPSKKPVPLSKLALELTAENGSTLFDHTTIDSIQSWPAAKAAQLLLAFQAFAPGGKCSGISISVTNAPWYGHAAFFLTGKNLFESLTLNLLVVNEAEPIRSKDDYTLWELDELPESTPYKQAANKSEPCGYLALLTCPSRSLHFIPSEDGKEVVDLRVAPGIALDTSNGLDPMKSYRILEIKKELAYLPAKLHEKRALWRDSLALFTYSQDDPDRRPIKAVVQANQAIAARLLVAEDHCIGLAALGLKNKDGGQGQQKFLIWRQERIPLPLLYLQNGQHDLRDCLKTAADTAEAIGSALGKATWRFAKEMLAYTTGKDVDRDAVSKLKDHYTQANHYWATLEIPYKRLIVKLAAASAEKRVTLVKTWATRQCAKHAIDCLSLITNKAEAAPRTLRASVYAQNRLKYLLFNKEDGILTRYYPPSETEEKAIA